MTEPFAAREGQAGRCLRERLREQAQCLAAALRDGSEYRPFVFRG